MTGNGHIEIFDRFSVEAWWNESIKMDYHSLQI
jgi:hypothetical protein